MREVFDKQVKCELLRRCALVDWCVSEYSDARNPFVYMFGEPVVNRNEDYLWKTETRNTTP